MADTLYRRAQPSILDLLAGGGGGTLPPVAPASPSPEGMEDGLLTAGRRNQLMDALLQPTNLGPEPEVEKPNIGGDILATLGDALGAYASAITGQARPQYLNTAAAKRELQVRERDQFRKQAALLEAQNRQRSAEILLSADDRKQIRADEIQGRKELKELTIAQQKAQQAQQEAQFQQQKAWEAQKQKEQMDFQERMNRADNITRERVARINGSEDKAAARIEKKDLGEAITFIGKTALNAKAMLAGQNGQPGMTPDQIEQIVSLTLDGLTLTPENRAAADAYFAKHVGPILHDASVEQMNKDLEAGSPQPEGGFSGFNLTKWMKARGF